MWQWIVIILILIGACFLPLQVTVAEKRNHHKYYKFKITLITVAIFLLLFSFRAFRAQTVGGDLVEYKTLFNYIGGWSWKEAFSISSGYEPGWVLLNKLLFLISSDFQIVMIVVAAITTFAIFWFAFKFSPDPWLTIFIYTALGFLGTSFNNERQALASAILLFSISFIQQRKFIKFLILLLLATSIHITSVIFIVVYFIYGVKLEKKFYLIALVVGIALFFLAAPLLNLAIQAIPFIRDKYGEASFSSGQGYGYLLMLVLFCAASFILHSEEQNKNRDMFIFMALIATVLQVFSLRMPYFQRLVKIFSVSLVVGVPYLLRRFDKGFPRNMVRIIIITALFVFYVNGLVNDDISLVPYATMFSA